MIRRTPSLTYAQISSVKLLLDGHSPKDISIQVGKDISTVNRWMNIPEVQNLISLGKRSLFEGCSARLASAMYLSVCVLEEIATDPGQKGADRVRAAVSIVELSLKLSENLDLQNRLQVLELAATIEISEDLGEGGG